MTDIKKLVNEILGSYTGIADSGNNGETSRNQRVITLAIQLVQALDEVANSAGAWSQAATLTHKVWCSWHSQQLKGDAFPPTNLESKFLSTLQSWCKKGNRFCPRKFSVRAY